MQISSQLINKYNKSIPRYTSYPTAPEWSSLDTNIWSEYINKLNNNTQEISLYFHLPFCESQCYFCACNTVISPNRELLHPYLQALINEIKFVSGKLNKNIKIQQIHFGGGTPTYLDTNELKILLDNIFENFNIDSESPNNEFSIEIDPRVTNKAQLELLATYGFSRVSMGVQDFTPNVQQAINRIQSVEQVKSLCEISRELGYKSINFDLIYGLPLQTLDGFSKTLELVSELSPDRIALFNYAHLPSLMPFQKKYIKNSELPSSEEKINIFTHSINYLSNNHYKYIGLDHFAKETDELALAFDNKTLHRNFQGYALKGNLDMLALGISGISDFQGLYSQNTKNLNNYLEHYSQNNITEPYIEKGYALSPDDIIRREIIKKILCEGSLDLNEYNIDFTQEIDDLQELITDNIVEITNNKLLVKNYLFLRNIASVFDIYLRKNKRQFSKSL